MINKEDIEKIEKEVKALRKVFINNILNENWKPYGTGYESKNFKLFTDGIWEANLIVKIDDNQTKTFDLYKIMNPIIFNFFLFFFINMIYIIYKKVNKIYNILHSCLE